MNDPESGDHIETNIGADARNVVVGKQNTQINVETVYMQGGRGSGGVGAGLPGARKPAHARAGHLGWLIGIGAGIAQIVGGALRTPWAREGE